MEQGTEDLRNEELAALYTRFLATREAAIINEIRSACGITAAAPTREEEFGPEDVAEDVREGPGPVDEDLNQLDLDAAAALR
jgi:hypothetical protein